MRRLSLVRSCLLVTLLAATLTIGASAASFGTGVVNASALRMRSHPTTESSTLTRAYRGDIVEVLSDAVDGWYHVTFNSKTGYMSAEYLVVTPFPVEEAPAEPEVNTEPVEPEEPESTETTEDTNTNESSESESAVSEEKTVTSGIVSLSYSTSKLNVRASASTSGKKLGTLSQGTVLTLEEYVDGWYRIDYNGVTGYVSAQYITVIDHLDPTKESTSTISGSEIASEVLKYVGCAYVYGGSGPKSFDCSGLTSYILRQFGFSIGRTASSQFGYGTSVDYADLQPGDLVFFRNFSSSKAATHVGIYIGDGNFVHAANSRSGVKITPMSESWYANRYVGARRFV